MLSTRLEAFRTAFSCVWRKDKFLVSPEMFSTGDRVLSTETRMLPLNDELWDGDNRPREWEIRPQRLRLPEYVKFTVKSGSICRASKIVVRRNCKAIRTASTITTLQRWECMWRHGCRGTCCVILLHADRHRQRMALHLSMHSCITALEHIHTDTII